MAGEQWGGGHVIMPHPVCVFVLFVLFCCFVSVFCMFFVFCLLSFFCVFLHVRCVFFVVFVCVCIFCVLFCVPNNNKILCFVFCVVFFLWWMLDPPCRCQSLVQAGAATNCICLAKVVEAPKIAEVFFSNKLCTDDDNHDV